MNRKDADTARRLQADPAGRAIEEAQQRIAAKRAEQADRERIRAIIAEATRKAVPMHTGGWVTANNVLAALDREGYTVAPRASQAAGEPHSTGCDSRAASDPGGGSAGHTEPRCGRAAVEGSCPDHPDASTERCESRHPEHGQLCTLPAGHDTHRHVGDAWTTLDRLHGHALISTGDLAEVLAYVTGREPIAVVTNETLDRLFAALKEATEADQ